MGISWWGWTRERDTRNLRGASGVGGCGRTSRVVVVVFGGFDCVVFLHDGARGRVERLNCGENVASNNESDFFSPTQHNSGWNSSFNVSGTSYIPL